MNFGSVFVCLIFVAGVRGVNIKNVWCLDENAMNERDLIKNINPNDKLCGSKQVHKYPWTYVDRRTPPAPEQLKLKYRIYKTNSENKTTKQIAIDVSWRNKLSDVEKHVEGYHLEINFMRPFGQATQYIMTWNENLTTALNNSSAIYVEFHFIYCGGDEHSHITPEDEYNFVIQAMPVYGEHDEPQRVKQGITIPDCGNKEMSRTNYCRKHFCPDGRRKRGKNCRPKISSSKRPKKEDPVESTTTTLQENHRSDGLSHFMFIIIGAILLLVLLVVIIGICAYRRNLYCFTNKEKSFLSLNRKVLVISNNENDIIFSQSIKKLILILKSNDRIQVTNNGWHTVEIAEQGSLKWMTKAVDDADFVVFLVYNEHAFVSEESVEEKLLEEGQAQHGFLKITQNIIHSLELSPQENHKKFLIADLNQCVRKKRFPYFQHFDLPSNFKKFSKHLMGDFLIDEDDNTIFINLLINAQLEHRKKITKFQNDLGFATFPSKTLSSNRAEMSVPLNIKDGPPSLESNASQPPYETTDFNISLDIGRHRTGARPKC